MIIGSTKTTSEKRYIKILLYGQSGAGKTFQTSTLDAPLLLDAEGGSLSLSNFDIPCVDVKTLSSMREAYKFLASSNEAKKFKSVIFDPITEAAELTLKEALKSNKDGRMAYGDMATTMMDLIKAYRDLPFNVVMICKLDKIQDELGRLLYSPAMPGKILGQSLPYLFDELLALRVERDAEGNSIRKIQCQTDGVWQAKDRSGKLSQFESANLQTIINKVSK